MLPESLVFRPLVKGNEDSGNEIVAFMVSSDGDTVVPSFAISLTISSLTFRNAFQLKGFAWPEKHPVLSAPLSAWNAGRAAVLVYPRA